MTDPSVSAGEPPHGGEIREGQRIAKVMARAGLCSRRDAEAWIAEGRVSVNGNVLESPAYNVSEADDVRVDGARLRAAERTRLFLFHKPRGLMTTARDPEGRPTIFDALPPELPRLVAIGRLDVNTEGLLLLSNDGGLARVLELPTTGWLRRYRVRAHGTVDVAALEALREGITIEGVTYAGIEAKLDREQGSNAWITMGLREGKNREIKKVLEHLGLAVNRLIRISFGPFELGELAEGEVAEVRTRVLREQLGAKLAKEAGANFDADIDVAKAPEPPARPAARGAGGERERRPSDRGERTERERRPPDSRPDEKRERFSRGAPPRRLEAAPRRFEAKDDKPREPVKPSVPERKRKHVSALRAEIAGDVGGGRKRLVRSATKDRKGRDIAVERLTPAHPEAAPKRRPARAGFADRKGAPRRDRAESTGPRAPARDHAPRGFADKRPSRGKFGERDRGERTSGEGETRSRGHSAPREGGREDRFKPRGPRTGPPRGAPREGGREENFEARPPRRGPPREGAATDRRDDRRDDRRPERAPRKGPPREGAGREGRENRRPEGFKHRGPPREGVAADRRDDRRPERAPRKGPPRAGAGREGRENRRPEGFKHRGPPREGAATDRRDDRRPERAPRKGPPRAGAGKEGHENRRPEGFKHRGPPRGAPRSDEPGRGPRRPPRKP